MRPDARNILVLKLGGIGDVLTATPALRAIREAWPAAHVALAAERPGIEVIAGSPLVDERLEFTALYRCRSLVKLASPAMLRQAAALRRAVRSRRWDILFCLQSLWRRSATVKPRLIARWSRAPIRAGLDTEGHGAFLTHKVPDRRFAVRHYVDRFLDVVRLVGCEPTDARTFVWLTEADRAEADAVLRAAGAAEGEALIGVHPGYNPEYIVPRQWPPERFAAVADALAEHHQCRIILTGSAADAPACGAVRGQMKRADACLDLSGRTTIKQLAACIARCRLFVSNDTGPMHVAVAVGTPTVGVFGPSDWQAYGTYPAGLPFRMVRVRVDCWPCRDVECEHQDCLGRIGAPDVLAACEELLGPAGV